MRILIDGRKLGDGGIGDYLASLASGLDEAGVEVGLVVRSESSIPSYLRPKWIYTDRAAPYSLDELFALPRRLPLGEFDLFHSPHYTLPFGLTIPSVVTIHDLIHVTHGQAWYYKYVALPQILGAVLRADSVFCVSNFTAAELCRFIPRKLIEHKLSITPNVVSHTWRRDSACPKVGDPYLLAVISTNKPHKGARDLLTAWGLVAHQLDRHRLVLVGAGSSGLDGERVSALGKVSDEQYSELFRGAEALIVPSTVEGFCVPALRAVYEGVPIIARPIPALKELAGEVGAFAESMSVEDLASAIFATVQGGGLEEVESGQSKRERIIERCGRSAVTAQVILAYSEAIKRRGKR